MDIKNHNQRHKIMTCVCLIYGTFNTVNLLQYYSKHIKVGQTQQYQLEAFILFYFLNPLLWFLLRAFCIGGYKYRFSIFHCGSMV